LASLYICGIRAQDYHIIEKLQKFKTLGNFDQVTS